MLLFYCPEESAFAKVCKKGVKGRIRLHTTLAAAQAATDTNNILVVDASYLVEPIKAKKGLVKVSKVPPEAFINSTPYRPPRLVVAAGGYVMRPGKKEPDVLLIHRRGVWDLPKGKLDPGETIEECGLREVREEVGIKALQLVRALSTTVHGYAEKKYYRVKTTYWFLMHTSETKFTPEARERIERVAWKPWRKALKIIGYDSLRDHMQEVEATVHKCLAKPTWPDR